MCKEPKPIVSDKGLRNIRNALLGCCLTTISLLLLASILTLIWGEEEAFLMLCAMPSGITVLLLLCWWLLKVFAPTRNYYKCSQCSFTWDAISRRGDRN